MLLCSSLVWGMSLFATGWQEEKRYTCVHCIWTQHPFIDAPLALLRVTGGWKPFKRVPAGNDPDRCITYILTKIFTPMGVWISLDLHVFNCGKHLKCLEEINTNPHRCCCNLRGGFITIVAFHLVIPNHADSSGFAGSVCLNDAFNCLCLQHRGTG